MQRGRGQTGNSQGNPVWVPAQSINQAGLQRSNVQRGRGQTCRPCENAKCNAEGVAYEVPKGMPSGSQCKTSARQECKECRVQRRRGQTGRPCENAKYNAEGVKSALPKGTPSGSQRKASTRQESKECRVQRGRPKQAGPAITRNATRNGAKLAVPNPREPRAGPSSNQQQGRIPRNAMCNAAGVK